MRAVLSSIGIVDSGHRPLNTKREFWRDAIPLLSPELKLGPVADIDLISIWRQFDVNLIVFEANRFLTRRLRYPKSDGANFPIYAGKTFEYLACHSLTATTETEKIHAFSDER
jgi:hypothetical protein